jgi:tRNA 2-thiocytidine biosynthesis protein TtcA
MPPKLRADDGLNVVIRPLAYCKESDIKKYSAAKQFPIIPCTLCGTQPNLQRQAMKEMVNQWEVKNPLWIKSMFTAMSNVVPSHMMDRELFDFNAFTLAAGAPVAGDTLFDPDEQPAAGGSVIRLI